MLSLAEVVDVYERYEFPGHSISQRIAATILDLERQIAALTKDNAGLLIILRELDYSDPARADAVLGKIRDQEHPGRALMGALTGRLAELEDVRSALVEVLKDCDAIGVAGSSFARARAAIAKATDK